MRGEIDELQGLKENVIIGLLIPAGTGIERYGKPAVTFGSKPAPQAVAEEQAGESE